MWQAAEESGSPRRTEVLRSVRSYAPGRIPFTAGGHIRLNASAELIPSHLNHQAPCEQAPCEHPLGGCGSLRV